MIANAAIRGLDDGRSCVQEGTSRITDLLLELNKNDTATPARSTTQPACASSFYIPTRSTTVPTRSRGNKSGTKAVRTRPADKHLKMFRHAYPSSTLTFRPRKYSPAGIFARASLSAAFRFVSAFASKRRNWNSTK